MIDDLVGVDFGRYWSLLLNRFANEAVCEDVDPTEDVELVGEL